MRGFLLRLAFSAALLAGAGGAGEAQAPAAPTAAAAPVEQGQRSVSNEARAARAKLEALKAQLDQNDAALARDLNDADLQRIRQEVDPLWQSTRAIIDEIQPRLDGARARLDQLGPKPKDPAAESPDVQRDRAEREAAVAELDETQRLARALLLQAEQI